MSPQKEILNGAVAARAVKRGDKLKLLKNGRVVRCENTERGVGFAQFDATKGEKVIYADLPPMPPVGELPDNIFNVLAARQSGAPLETVEPPYKPAPQILYDVRREDHQGFAHVAIAVRLKQCPRCGRLLVPSNLDHLIPKTDLYVRTSGKSLDRIGEVCVDCYMKEMASKFVCDGCNTERPTSEEQWHQHGNGHVRLCTTCYATLTAQEWDQLTEELVSSIGWSD